ncbi:hemerythrin HHE cation binding domain-containing protein [Armillaria luteobubalina]|uniref:Hemerythrin HHE cation binding domain-containing protein n=1 Tax=Armillaria luteobubalina TaxID=153913 RepID=A0AA39QMT2_9AGAR|nr:hemerythrin HHE cation binding domain-containing protein [Armillaria luteobubalina]
MRGALAKFLPSRSRMSLHNDAKWNTLSNKMSNFHEWFKAEFNTLYDLADGSFTKRGLSLSLYLDSARQFERHLTMHHTIEERYIFPILAQRMPEFSDTADDGHVKSHQGIHHGLEELSNLVTKWKEEPSSYSPTGMKTCLDSFKGVLFSHLDQEVLDLRGENMKKYWKLEELDSIPM